MSMPPQTTPRCKSCPDHPVMEDTGRRMGLGPTRFVRYRCPTCGKGRWVLPSRPR